MNAFFQFTGRRRRGLGERDAQLLEQAHPRRRHPHAGRGALRRDVPVPAVWVTPAPRRRRQLAGSREPGGLGAESNLKGTTTNLQCIPTLSFYDATIL